MIHKRGKVWYTDFIVNGKRVAKSTRKTNKQEAMAVAVQLRQQAEEETSNPLGGLPLSRAVDKLYRTWQHQASGDQTRARMMKVVEILGDPPINRITGADVEKLRDHLRETGAKPATINRYLAHLKMVLRHAWLRWNAITSMPHIQMEKENNSRVRWLSDEEEAKLIELSPPPFNDLWKVLLDTGMRVGECLKAGPTHLDMEDGVIRLTGDITKSGKPRTIPMTPRVAEVYLRLGTVRPFPFTNDRVSKLFKKVARTMRLDHDPDFTPHALRHTTASRLVMRGVDLYRVKTLLGHSSVKTTERYAHLKSDDLRDAIGFL
jgi:integrase